LAHDGTAAAVRHGIGQIAGVELAQQVVERGLHRELAVAIRVEQGLQPVLDRLALIRAAVGQQVGDVLGADGAQVVERLLHVLRTREQAGAVVDEADVGGVEVTQRREIHAAVEGVVLHYQFLVDAQFAQEQIVVEHPVWRHALGGDRGIGQEGQDVLPGFLRRLAHRGLPVVARHEAFAVAVERQFHALQVEFEHAAGEIGAALRRVADDIGEQGDPVIAPAQAAAVQLEPEVAVPLPDVGFRVVDTAGSDTGFLDQAAQFQGIGGEVIAQESLGVVIEVFPDPVALVEARRHRAHHAGLGAVVARPLEGQPLRGRVEVVHFHAEQVVADALIHLDLTGAGVAGVAAAGDLAQLQGEQRGAERGIRRLVARVDGIGAPFHLQHGLAACGGIGAMQGGIEERGLFQGGHAAFPDVGIEDQALAAVSGRDRVFRLGIDGHGGRAIQPRRHAFHIEHAGLNADVRGARRVGVDPEPPHTRRAAADGIEQRHDQARLLDVVQFVPVGVQNHPALLQIDAGIPPFGLKGIA